MKSKKKSKKISGGKISLIVLCFLYLFISVVPMPHASAKDKEETVCPVKTCFDENKAVNGKKLFLAGIAFFHRAFFQIYEVALYVPRGVRNEREVLSNEVPKTLVVEYDHDIDVRELFGSFQKSLSSNQAGDKILKKQITEIAAAVFPIRGGERHEFVYEPGKGTTLFKNGESKLRIPGDRFARTFFSFWLNRHNNGNQLLRPGAWPVS